MKLYRISYDDPQQGGCVQWVGSLAEAARCRAAIRKRLGDRNPIMLTSAKDVPTSKDQLIHFLNIFAGR